MLDISLIQQRLILHLQIIFHILDINEQLLNLFLHIFDIVDMAIMILLGFIQPLLIQNEILGLFLHVIRYVFDFDPEQAVELL